jgi:hypothetical protein
VPGDVGLVSTPVLNVNFNMPAADLKQWAMDRTTWIQGRVELTFEKFSELAGLESSMPELKKTTRPLPRRSMRLRWLSWWLQKVWQGQQHPP